MNPKAPLAAFSAAACLAAAAAAAHALPAGGDEMKVETAFRAWEAAFVARDAATLNSIAAPGFVQTEGGQELDRATAIGMPTQSPDYRIEDVRIEEVHVAAAADTARLTGVTVVRETFSGRTYTTRKAVTETWTRHGGAWLLSREELKELK